MNTRNKGKESAHKMLLCVISLCSFIIKGCRTTAMNHKGNFQIKQAESWRKGASLQVPKGGCKQSNPQGGNCLMIGTQSKPHIFWDNSTEAQKNRFNGKLQINLWWATDDMTFFNIFNIMVFTLKRENFSGFLLSS